MINMHGEKLAEMDVSPSQVINSTHVTKEELKKVEETFTKEFEELDNLQIQKIKSVKKLLEHKIFKNTLNLINHQRRQSIIISNLYLIIKLLIFGLSLTSIGFIIVCTMLFNKINDYNNTITMLTNTIIEEQKEITDLNTQIEDLMNKFENFKEDITSITPTPQVSTSNIESDKISLKVADLNSTNSKKKEINTTDITKPSNLSADQLDEIINYRLSMIGISSSKFSNLGQELYNMENTYNVNALFCLSVGSLESGHGTSNAARNKNNLFGLIGSKGLMSFESPGDCVNYWGKLIRNSYINKRYTTINSIQKKYCPGSSTWSSNIQSFMNTYASIAINLE